MGDDGSSAAAAAVDTPPAVKKNVRGLRTRKKLVDAAVACFSEYGYAQTRVADIVFHAGVSQGNFYRHFESKEAIFLEALKPGMDELLAASSRSQEPPRDPFDALVDRTNAYLVSYAQNRRLLRVLREAAAMTADSDFARVWLDQRRQFIDRTRRWLESRHRSGDVGETDFELLAECLGSMVEQMAYVHIGLPERAPRPERVRAIAVSIAEVWHRALPPVT